MALYAFLSERMNTAVKTALWTTVIVLAAGLLLITGKYAMHGSLTPWPMLLAVVLATIVAIGVMHFLMRACVQHSRFQRTPWFCSDAALLLGLWFLSQALPLWGDWRVSVWLQQWRELIHTNFNIWLLPQAVTIGLVIGVILRERDQDGRRAWEYIALILFLQAMAGLVGQVGSLTDWLGLLLGAIGAMLLPSNWRNTTLFTVSFAVTLLLGLKPLLLLSQAKSFHWQPFWSLSASEPGVVLQAMADKVFWCALLVWCALRQEMAPRLAIAITVCWLLIIEVVQLYLVAHTSELFEVILVMMMAVVLLQWPAFWRQVVVRHKTPTRGRSAVANQPKSTAATAN